VNAQQVLPGAEVSLEAQGLRDLEARDDLAVNGLVPLIGPLAHRSILLSSLAWQRCATNLRPRWIVGASGALQRMSCVALSCSMTAATRFIVV
jgi:hypothetical protein